MLNEGSVCADGVVLLCVACCLSTVSVCCQCVTLRGVVVAHCVDCCRMPACPAAFGSCSYRVKAGEVVVQLDCVGLWHSAVVCQRLGWGRMGENQSRCISTLLCAQPKLSGIFSCCWIE